MDKGRLKDWNHKKTLIEVKKKAAITERAALLKKLAAVEIYFEKESLAEGRLFGSVTIAEISNQLEKKHKLLVDKRDILLAEPLKEVGEHEVTVALDSENKMQLKVTIKQKVSEKDTTEEKSKTGFFSKRFFSKTEDPSETIVNNSQKTEAQEKEPPTKEDPEENKE